MGNGKKINKRHNHNHFWVEDEVLYESYNTIRGLRFSKVLDVKGFHHCNECTEEVIKLIEQVYLQ